MIIREDRRRSAVMEQDGRSSGKSFFPGIITFAPLADGWRLMSITYCRDQEAGRTIPATCSPYATSAIRGRRPRRTQGVDKGMSSRIPSSSTAQPIYSNRQDLFWEESITDKKPLRKKKEPSQFESWPCPRCGTTVHVIADHHAYLCAQYWKLPAQSNNELRT